MPRADETPGFVTEFDEAFTGEVLACAEHRVPAFARARVEPGRSRAGLYEMTPDHHAILGEAHAAAGLFFANGFSGHGVMHSPATGLIIAELILEGRPRSFDISPLALDRFNGGRIYHETTFL